MEVKDAIYKRRSVRDYNPDVKIPRDALDRIVAAGIEAPSGCNAQLRHFIIVDNEKIMSQLRMVSSAMKNAPAAIVVVMDPTPTKYGEFWIQDSSAAMENMQLMAVDEGYSSCWIEGPMRQAEPLFRKVLGVPENLRVWAMMPVGKAQTIPGRPQKKTAEEIVSYNKFQQ
ncbi:MAG TPA: nitroreductase family protein [Phycisphaerae bacterium]|nr:nitroreductase family protein [Phycisphaerae bacterium]HPS52719.1 nitroreductase family protein [Phycisphaerae bacterium]